jgi:hypothetical protein
LVVFIAHLLFFLVIVTAIADAAKHFAIMLFFIRVGDQEVVYQLNIIISRYITANLKAKCKEILLNGLFAYSIWLLF